jgi:hypothetical protein
MGTECMHYRVTTSEPAIRAWHAPPCGSAIHPCACSPRLLRYSRCTANCLPLEFAVSPSTCCIDAACALDGDGVRRRPHDLVRQYRLAVVRCIGCGLVVRGTTVAHTESLVRMTTRPHRVHQRTVAPAAGGHLSAQCRTGSRRSEASASALEAPVTHEYSIDSTWTTGARASRIISARCEGRRDTMRHDGTGTTPHSAIAVPHASSRRRRCTCSCVRNSSSPAAAAVCREGGILMVGTQSRICNARQFDRVHHRRARATAAQEGREGRRS